jgi:hypothetical protein
MAMTSTTGRLTNEDLARRIIIRARATQCSLKAVYGPAVDPVVELKRPHNQRAHTKPNTKPLDTEKSIRIAISGRRKPAERRFRLSAAWHGSASIAPTSALGRLQQKLYFHCVERKDNSAALDTL